METEEAGPFLHDFLERDEGIGAASVGGPHRLEPASTASGEDDVPRQTRRVDEDAAGGEQGTQS